jgi:hypothetical protein
MNSLESLRALPESIPGEINNIRNPVLIRFFAHLFSFIFHPLFIPLYVSWYLTFIHPGYFNGIEEREKMLVLIRVAVNMVFLPLVSVLLVKAVGFIDSIFLKTKKDRIIPYVISNFFFFWMYLVFRNQSEIPSIFTSFFFSVFLSSSVALIANIYFKISMHAIGAGGLLGLFLVILHTNTTSTITLPFVLAILITGIVCTSRMIVSNHTQKDIYLGLIFGIVCQVIGAAIIL